MQRHGSVAHTCIKDGETPSLWRKMSLAGLQRALDAPRDLLNNNQPRMTKKMLISTDQHKGYQS